MSEDAPMYALQKKVAPLGVQMGLRVEYGDSVHEFWFGLRLSERENWNQIKKLFQKISYFKSNTLKSEKSSILKLTFVTMFIAFWINSN